MMMTVKKSRSTHQMLPTRVEASQKRSTTRRLAVLHSKRWEGKNQPTCEAYLSLIDNEVKLWVKYMKKNEVCKKRTMRIMKTHINEHELKKGMDECIVSQIRNFYARGFRTLKGTVHKKGNGRLICRGWFTWLKCPPARVIRSWVFSSVLAQLSNRACCYRKKVVSLGAIWTILVLRVPRKVFLKSKISSYWTPNRIWSGVKPHLLMKDGSFMQGRN